VCALRLHVGVGVEVGAITACSGGHRTAPRAAGDEAGPSSVSPSSREFVRGETIFLTELHQHQPRFSPARAAVFTGTAFVLHR
jgi:hypothetical protein